MRLGVAKPVPIKKGQRSREIFDFSAINMLQMAENFDDFNTVSNCLKGKSFIANSGDECVVDSWVFAKQSATVCSIRLIHLLKLSI